jgi:hypothetical protein
MNTWKRFGFAVGTAALLALAPAAARADLTLQTGLVGGSGDVSNVVFNPCGLGSQIGTTVFGCLNDSPSTLVAFTGQEELKIDEGGGQAKIQAVDGAFDYVNIKLDDPSLGFTKLQFNIMAADDGTATFVGVDQFGTVFDFGAYAISGSGQNFFTLDSLDGQVAVSFTITSTVAMQNISELQQVRIGPTVIETPEPMSMAVLGVGLLGLGMVRMRRRQPA